MMHQFAGNAYFILTRVSNGLTKPSARNTVRRNLDVIRCGSELEELFFSERPFILFPITVPTLLG